MLYKTQFLQLIATVMATGFGAGLLPKAPGTWGTLVGVGIAYGLSFLDKKNYFLILLVTTILGIWAAKEYDLQHHSQDNPCIVIDEIIGFMLIVAWTKPHILLWPLAFIIFRFLDIVKIAPVSWVDTLSQTSPQIWVRAFCIIADDILAALQGCLVLESLKKILRFE